MEKEKDSCVKPAGGPIMAKAGDGQSPEPQNKEILMQTAKVGYLVGFRSFGLHQRSRV